MVNGASGTMVSVRDRSDENSEGEIDATDSKRNPNEMLPVLPNPTFQEALQWEIGRQQNLPEKKILQSGLYGESDGGENQSPDCAQQPTAINEDGQAKMRDLQSVGFETGSTPQGRKSDEQR